MDKDLSRRRVLQMGALAAVPPLLPGQAHAAPIREEPVVPKGFPRPRSWVVQPFELGQVTLGQSVFRGACNDPRFVDPLLTWSTASASPNGCGRSPSTPTVASASRRRCAPAPAGRLRAVASAPDGTLWFSTSNRDGRGAPLAGDDRIVSTTSCSTPAVSIGSNRLVKAARFGERRSIVDVPVAQQCQHQYPCGGSDEVSCRTSHCGDGEYTAAASGVTAIRVGRRSRRLGTGWPRRAGRAMRSSGAGWCAVTRRAAGRWPRP